MRVRVCTFVCKCVCVCVYIVHVGVGVGHPSFLTAMSKYSDPKQLGGKAVFGLHFLVTVYSWGKSGQELKQELETETMEEGCLLTHFEVHT